MRLDMQEHDLDCLADSSLQDFGLQVFSFCGLGGQGTDFGGFKQLSTLFGLSGGNGFTHSHGKQGSNEELEFFGHSLDSHFGKLFAGQVFSGQPNGGFTKISLGSVEQSGHGHTIVIIPAFMS